MKQVELDELIKLSVVQHNVDLLKVLETFTIEKPEVRKCKKCNGDCEREPMTIWRCKDCKSLWNLL